MNPRILTLDIETLPAKVWAWGLFDQNIGIDQVIEPSKIMMIGAKWLGEKRFIQYDLNKHDRRRMLGAFHTLLSAADAVVTYNGNRFDLTKINGEMIQLRLPPLPQITSIDLLPTVKKMGLLSSKLAWVVEFLGIGQKMKTGGFELWTQCAGGNAKAWAKMRRYNKRDVLLTEAAYRRLRPYMLTHPRLVDRKDRPHCRECGSTEVQFRGQRSTRATKFDRFQCVPCGAWDSVPQRKRK